MQRQQTLSYVTHLLHSSISIQSQCCADPFIFRCSFCTQCCCRRQSSSILVPGFCCTIKTEGSAFGRLPFNEQVPGVPTKITNDLTVQGVLKRKIENLKSHPWSRLSLLWLLPKLSCGCSHSWTLFAMTGTKMLINTLRSSRNNLRSRHFQQFQLLFALAHHVFNLAKVRSLDLLCLLAKLGFGIAQRWWCALEQRYERRMTFWSGVPIFLGGFSQSRPVQCKHLFLEPWQSFDHGLRACAR